MNKRNAPPCGTVACIAGWACILGGSEDDVYGGKAARLLDIESNYDNLFYPEEWANKALYQTYLNAKTNAKRARIVGQVIDEFIAANQD